jgi:hypothetical protein
VSLTAWKQKLLADTKPVIELPYRFVAGEPKVIEETHDEQPLELLTLPAITALKFEYRNSRYSRNLHNERLCVIIDAEDVPLPIDLRRALTWPSSLWPDGVCWCAQNAVRLLDIVVPSGHRKVVVCIFYFVQRQITIQFLFLCWSRGKQPTVTLL